jgi:hypothetical protein
LYREVHDNYMILPIHQNPADLSLNILTTRLHLPLTVLKQHTLQIGAWSLQFHIIGESHLVTIEHDGVLVLSELLACVEVEASACLHHHRFNDLAAHCFQQLGYSIAVEFSDCYEDVPVEVDGVIEVAFPEIADQTPITRIVWTRIGEHAVRWHTLHVYPGEDKMACVHSLSYFDMLNYNRAL